MNQRPERKLSGLQVFQSAPIPRMAMKAARAIARNMIPAQGITF